MHEVAKRQFIPGRNQKPRRRHIFDEQHKKEVQEERLRTREEQIDQLYDIRRRRGEFNSNRDAFRSWLDYRAHLERISRIEALEASPSLVNLHEPAPFPELTRSQTVPVAQASDGFIQRALQNAKQTLKSKPPPSFSPSLDRLRLNKLIKSQQVEDRLRPKKKPLPTSLPANEEAEVDDLLHKRGVISKCAREQVSDKDLQRLRPGQWLNDEVINFYGQMILSRSELSNAKSNKENNSQSSKPLNVHYFNTFFWSKLTGEGYERARLAKWTKRIDIFSKDIILIPVNHGNAHWTGAAINFRQKRIESYDSMGMARQNVYKALRGYLDAEHKDKKKKPFDFTGWEDYTLEDTPQQENGYDCGVFTCQFLETLSRGEDSFAFSQSNMTYLRRRMIWEIGHAKLRDDT
ncbi:cysteine proteinase [Trametopsis cervina]|nr:cysteine proteinase [Trametopsis cervina]